MGNAYRRAEGHLLARASTLQYPSRANYKIPTGAISSSLRGKELHLSFPEAGLGGLVDDCVAIPLFWVFPSTKDQLPLYSSPVDTQPSMTFPDAHIPL